MALRRFSHDISPPLTASRPPDVANFHSSGSAARASSRVGGILAAPYFEERSAPAVVAGGSLRG